MKPILCWLLLSAVCLAADLSGLWKGAIQLPGDAELGIQVKLAKPEGGEWQGFISIPAQGLENFGLSEIQVDGGKISFAMAGIPGKPNFDGALNDGGGEISGKFRQGGQNLTFALKRTDKPLVLNRPQEPKPPFPYASKEVSFRNEADDVKLAGTLLIPDGEGPFPAVLFVSGSGPQDRDETLVGHKPFWVIADFLARQGIASLRYDDRGTAKSSGDHFETTTGGFADDAAAGLGFLSRQAQIRRDAIGIVGHSEGGLTGPKIAAKGGTELDFLVLLAPPGVPLDELVLRQTQEILRVEGMEAAFIEQSLKFRREDLALMRDAALTNEQLREKLKAAHEKRRKETPADHWALLQLDEAGEKVKLLMSASTWMRSLVAENPANYLKNVRIPTLALLGENDLQVAVEPNAAAIREALVEAKNPDFEVAILPGLNHLFQHSPTGKPSEYGSLEETIAPEALQRMSRWILERYGE